MSNFLPFPGVMNRGLCTSLGAFKYIQIFCVLFCFSPSRSPISDRLWRTRGLFLETILLLEIINLAALLLDTTLSEMLMAHQRSQHVLPKGLLSIKDTSVLSSRIELLTASTLTTQLLFTVS